jgi:cyclopropane fatty-acyl-phospholipid synthase-like methyltransferase
MSWYKKWFNSPLYEKLYANRNEEEATFLADFIEKIIPKSKYPEILDLGCGRGRHSITFAKRRYNVTGIDLSEKAIETAITKSDSERLDNTHFEIRDMRDPIDKKFDAIVNLFTTFGYFLDDDENRNVLKSASEMLRKDGIFILDYLNAVKVKKEINPTETGKIDDMDYTIKRKIADGMVFKSITFSHSSYSEPVTFSERVKLYELHWFEENLATTGFEITDVFGDYRGNSFDETESPRLLIISKKR